jgi:hypothetical protein
MHTGDVLVIGPIRPRGSRVLRVPIRHVLIAGLVVTLAMGLTALALAVLATRQFGMEWLPNLLGISKTDNSVATTRDNPTFAVDSEPAGATVHGEGYDYGRTPAAISAPTGKILTLQRDGFLDAFAISSGGPLSIQLWNARPEVRTIRPPAPGELITSANFLPGGRVALAVQVPPTGEHQAWAYDPIAAAVERLGDAVAPGALPVSVAIAPDGVAAAAIVHLDGLDGAPSDRLELDDADGQHDLLSNDAAVRGERLLDVSWSPTGDGVLVLVQQPVNGGSHFHLLFAERNGQGRNLAELAGQPIVGSWVWAPDGHAVAFLTRAGGLALATLDITHGGVRYVDDLGNGNAQGAASVAPATWDAAGRLLYAAPLHAGGVDSTNNTPVLLAVDPGRTDAHRVGTIEPVFAPIVRADGLLLTLARAGGDELVLRPVDPSGHVLAEQHLGVTVSGGYGARWDLEHGQLLILRATADGAVDVLLLRFVQEKLP